MAQAPDKLEQIHIGKKGAAPIAVPGWTAKSADRVKLLDQGLHLPGSGYANTPFRRGRRRQRRIAAKADGAHAG